jgi:hypothetical protein
VTDPSAAGSGQGGGGGGGSGGAILLQARDALNITAGATFSAVGGAGGQAASQNGGAGGLGRIAFMAFAGNIDSPAADYGNDAGATTNPPAGSAGTVWTPTEDVASAGVSDWIDMVTPSAVFSTSVPFWADNFGLLTATGLAQGPGLDFDAIVEYQGAATLNDVNDPTAATGLTAWSVDRSVLDGKQYVRWRWRFFVSHPDGNAMNDPDFNPSVHAMPAILDFTLPFTK